MTTHVNDWLRAAEKRLAAAGIETSARLDAQLLASEVLNKDRALLIADQSQLTAMQAEALEKLLTRREAREPLAYILGSREFYGIEFKINPEVLIPRPETERMVEYVIETAAKKVSMLELGTGSGAIAVSIKTHRSDLAITATDISPTALQTAQANADHNQVELEYIESDLFSKLTDQQYDVIAANLPYVPTVARRQQEITYEPDVALYGDFDGLEHYRRFFTEVSSYLKPAGWIIIEASPTQHRALKELAATAQFNLEAISEYIFVITRKAL